MNNKKLILLSLITGLPCVLYAPKVEREKERVQPDHPYARNLLIEAVKNNDEQEVVRLLELEETSVNAQDGNGRTALIEAMAARSYGIVQHLLNAGAKVDHADHRGSSAKTLASGDAFLTNLLFECEICREHRTENNSSVPCAANHRFHDTCITNWFQYNGTCPKCRAVVRPESIPPVNPTQHTTGQHDTLREVVVHNRGNHSAGNMDLVGRWLLYEVENENRPQEIRDVLQGYDFNAVVNRGLRHIESFAYTNPVWADRMSERILSLEGVSDETRARSVIAIIARLRASVMQERETLPQNNGQAAGWLLRELARHNRPQEIREVLAGYDLNVVALNAFRRLVGRGDAMSQLLRTKMWAMEGVDRTVVNDLMDQYDRGLQDAHRAELRASVMRDREILPQNNEQATRWLIGEVEGDNRPQEIREVLAGYDLNVVAFRALMHRCADHLGSGPAYQQLSARIMAVEGVDRTVVNDLMRQYDRGLQDAHQAELRARVVRDRGILPQNNEQAAQWLIRELERNDRQQNFFAAQNLDNVRLQNIQEVLAGYDLNEVGFRAMQRAGAEIVWSISHGINIPGLSQRFEAEKANAAQMLFDEFGHQNRPEEVERILSNYSAYNKNEIVFRAITLLKIDDEETFERVISGLLKLPDIDQNILNLVYARYSQGVVDIVEKQNMDALRTSIEQNNREKLPKDNGLAAQWFHYALGNALHQALDNPHRILGNPLRIQTNANVKTVLKGYNLNEVAAEWMRRYQQNYPTRDLVLAPLNFFERFSSIDESQVRAILVNERLPALRALIMGGGQHVESAAVWLLNETNNRNRRQEIRTVLANYDINAVVREALRLLNNTRATDAREPYQRAEIKATIYKLFSVGGTDRPALWNYAVNDLRDFTVSLVVAKVLDAEEGANVHTRIHSLLLRNASTIDRDVVRHAGLTNLKELLAVPGIDVNFRDEEGKTALMHAALGRAPGRVKTLLDAGADINIRDNNGRNVVIHAVAQSNPGGVLKYLLNSVTLDKQARDNEGMTAIGHALQLRNRSSSNEMVARLREAGFPG